MENNQSLSPDVREVGRNCTKTVSRCNFSTTMYLVVCGIAASIISGAITYALIAFLGQDGYVSVLENPLYYNIINWSLQVICMYIIGYPVFHSLTKHLPRRDKTEKEKLGFFRFIGIFLMLEGVMIIGSIIANIVTEFVNDLLNIEVTDTTGEFISQTPIGIVILVVVIIGPIFEELIFRKMYIDAIGKYSTTTAIFVSATAFALFHGNITQIIYTFGVGLILGWVYAKTKKIIYPIILHMLLNFFGSVPSLLVEDSINRILSIPESEWVSALSDPTFLLDYLKVMAVSLMQYGFIFVGGIILLIMIFGRKFKLDTSGEVKFGFFRKLRIYVFNLGTFILVIYTVITVLLNLFLPVIEQALESLT